MEQISANERMFSELLIVPDCSVSYIQTQYGLTHPIAENVYNMLNRIKDMITNTTEIPHYMTDEFFKNIIDMQICSIPLLQCRFRLSYTQAKELYEKWVAYRKGCNSK